MSLGLVVLEENFFTRPRTQQNEDIMSADIKKDKRHSSNTQSF